MKEKKKAGGGKSRREEGRRRAEIELALQTVDGGGGLGGIFAGMNAETKKGKKRDTGRG